MSRQGAQSPGLLVLVGSGRSGTVFMSGALRTVYGFGFAAEPKFVYTWFQKRFASLDLRDPNDLDQAIITAYSTRIFQNLNEAKGIATSLNDLRVEVCSRKIEDYQDFIEGVFRYVADVRGDQFPAYKDPLDVNHVEQLGRLLPRARFLHIVRDGRDVAQSLLRMPWGPTNLYRGLRFWADGVNRGRSGANLLPDRYCEFRYEDVISGDREVIDRIDDFVRPLAGIQRAGELSAYLAEKSDPSSLFRWRTEMSHNDRVMADRTVGETLRRFGYQTDNTITQPIGLAKRSSYTLSDYLARSRNALIRRSAGRIARPSLRQSGPARGPE